MVSRLIFAVGVGSLRGWFLGDGVDRGGFCLLRQRTGREAWEGLQEAGVGTENLQQQIDGGDRYVGSGILYQVCLTALGAYRGRLIFRQQCFEQTLSGGLYVRVGELLLDLQKRLIEQEFHGVEITAGCLQCGWLPVEMATLLHEQGQLPLRHCGLLLKTLNRLLQKLLLVCGQLSLVCEFRRRSAEHSQHSLGLLTRQQVERLMGLVLDERDVKCRHQP